MKKDHPLMYKGFVIRRCSNGKLGALCYSTDLFLNPLYDTWEQLKTIIDALK